MSVRKWTITTHVTGQQRDVDLYLYDKPRHMRAAATRHSKWSGETGGFYDAAAVCHGFTRIRIDADGSEHPDTLVSIIRLNREKLTPLVVSHEVAHAAQHIYGLDHIAEGDAAADHFGASNEDFAHLFGELYQAVSTALGGRV